MAGCQKRLSVFLAALLTAAAAGPLGASTAGDSRAAQKAYEKNEYDAAAETYRKGLEKAPESDVLNFGLGTTLYKQEQYADAIRHLEKSLLSDDPDLQARAQYNLGNAYYQDGIGMEDQKTEQAVQQLEKSLEHYEAALKYDDKDGDAHYNYDFVKNELQRLKEKLKKQESPKSPSPGKSGQNQDQNKQDEKKDGEGQDKPSAGEKNQPDASKGGQPRDPPGDQGEEDSTSASPRGQPPSGSPEDSQEDSSKPDNTDQQKNTAGNNADDNDVDQPAPGTESGAPQNGSIPRGQLSEKEAKMLLENYQNNEEPRGLLNFMKNKGRESPVVNDW